MNVRFSAPPFSPLQLEYFVKCNVIKEILTSIFNFKQQQQANNSMAWEQVPVPKKPLVATHKRKTRLTNYS